MQSYMTKTDFLKSLQDNGKITPDGKEWLTLALDPFHDYTHQVAGYPDSDGSQTVVSCYQYEKEVNCGALNSTWACHIFNSNLASSNQMAVLTETADWTATTEAANAPGWSMAPLVISVAANPLQLAPQIPIAAGNPTYQVVPELGTTDISGGNSRVIGMGWEVTNTTADIYKQGAVTVYRVPQYEAAFQNTTTNIGATQKSTAVGVKFRQPPATVAQANLLKGTRTWAARDGVYATAVMNSIHNPIKGYSNQAILYGNSTTPDAATDTVWQNIYTTVGTSAAVSTTTFQAAKTIPFDTTGAFFTGLSKETTLIVKLRVYVERAPTFLEPSLSVLASPSAGYDVNALSLYSQAINMLPVAVKVGENEAGDWWRAICRVLKYTAGPLGAIANTFLPGAGLVAQGIGKAAASYTNDGGSTKQITAAMEAKPRVKVVSQQRQPLAQMKKKKKATKTRK